jgi:hypothetical protein
LHLMAGRLVPALKVAGGHTLPFLNCQTTPFFKLYGMSSCDL